MASLGFHFLCNVGCDESCNNSVWLNPTTTREKNIWTKQESNLGLLASLSCKWPLGPLCQCILSFVLTHEKSELDAAVPSISNEFYSELNICHKHPHSNKRIWTHPNAALKFQMVSHPGSIRALLSNFQWVFVRKKSQ